MITTKLAFTKNCQCERALTFGFCAIGNDTQDPFRVFLLPLTPFSPALYYLWLALMVLLPPVFLMLDYIIRNHPKERMFNIVNSVWFVNGSFTQAELEIFPRRISTRLLAIVMWAFVLVILSAYIGGEQKIIFYY